MNDNNYGELKIKYDTVCMHEEELIAAVTILREAIIAIPEWVEIHGSSYSKCLWCHGLNRPHPLGGHKPYCKRQVALGLVESING